MSDQVKGIRFVLAGQPITKKNNGIMLPDRKIPTIVPSKAFQKYQKECLKQFKCMLGLRKFEGWVHVQAHYYLKDRAHWPDWTGLTQATGDILEKAGIIENDKWIARWDGTLIAGIDKENPRAEITIFPLPDWEEKNFGRILFPKKKQENLF